MSDRPSQLIFDPFRIRQNRDRAAPRFNQHAFLREFLSTELLERVSDVSRQFAHALDYGAHIGDLSLRLLEHPQIASVTSAETSPRMAKIAAARGLNMVCCDLEHPPFAPQCFDLVTSLMSLHWVNDLPGLLRAFRHLMRPDGLLLAGMFGAGTLSELRTCLIAAENEVMGGIAPRLSPLPGLQDAGRLLQHAGFALPVADVETITVRYAHPMKLLADLKGMGQQAAFMYHEDAPGRPLTRRILHRMCEIYQAKFSDADGKVRASFEVIWLSGWAPAPGQPQPLRPGTARHSLAEALNKKTQSGP